MKETTMSLTPSIQRDAALPTRFVLRNVRVAYAHGLNAPQAQQQQQQPGQQQGDPKYSAVFLFPEAAADVLQGVQGILWEAVQKEFGQTAQAVWQELAASNKLCLRSGATKASQEGFAGNYFISGSAKQSHPPVLLHKFLNEQGTGPQELKRPQNVIYSGAYVNVQLNVWVQNNNYGRRVNCEILVVQFAADGESFGGGASADTSVFGGIAAPTAAIGGAPTAPGFAAPAAAPGFAAPAAAPSFAAPAAAPGFAAPAAAPAAAPGFAAPF